MATSATNVRLIRKINSFEKMHEGGLRWVLAKFKGRIEKKPRLWWCALCSGRGMPPPDLSGHEDIRTGKKTGGKTAACGRARHEVSPETMWVRTYPACPWEASVYQVHSIIPPLRAARLGMCVCLCVCWGASMSRSGLSLACPSPPDRSGWATQMHPHAGDGRGV